MITSKDLIYMYSEDKDYTDFSYLNDDDLMITYNLVRAGEINFNSLSLICFLCEVISREND